MSALAASWCDPAGGSPAHKAYTTTPFVHECWERQRRCVPPQQRQRSIAQSERMFFTVSVIIASPARVPS
jgi:hypothetical protein